MDGQHEEAVEQGYEEGPARRRGRKGVKTSATVKFNKYDRTFHGRHAFVHFPDEEEVPYSLNKAKRWQQVDEVKREIARNTVNGSDDEGDAEGTEDVNATASKKDKKEEGRITQVLEVKAHLREQVGGLSLKVPRHGFSGGGFYKEKRGRDYTRIEAVVCAECGTEQVFTPHDQLKPIYSFKHTPEELALMRKERKAKKQQEKDRRAKRNLRRAPKVEKKDLRRAHETTVAERDEEDEKRSGEEEEEALVAQVGQTEPASSEDSGESEDQVENESEDSDGEDDEEYIYLVEVDSSDDDATNSDPERPAEESATAASEPHGTGDDEEAHQSDGEKEGETGEDDDEEHGGKVLKSQERQHVKLKEGRIIVQQPFEKGQYPMYRETNWKYSGPCMCCLHSQGKMWILKGMGDKSKGKTKGFCKIRRRDFKYALKGEV